MTPENHQRIRRDWKGMTRQYYAMPFGERYIWGVTAGILRESVRAAVSGVSVRLFCCMFCYDNQPRYFLGLIFLIMRPL